MSSSSHPSRAGYIVGLLLILAAGVASVAGIGLGAKFYVNGAQEAPRDAVPNTRTIQLQKDDERTLIAFAPSKEDTAAVGVKVTSPNDTSIPVKADNDASTVLGEVDKLQTAIVGTFSAPQNGTYTITSSGPQTAKLAVSEVTAADTLLWTVGGVAVGAVLGLIGLITLITTAVRRRRNA